MTRLPIIYLHEGDARFIVERFVDGNMMGQFGTTTAMIAMQRGGPYNVPLSSVNHVTPGPEGNAMIKCIKINDRVFVRADAIVAVTADSKDENRCEVTVSGALCGDISDGGSMSSDLRAQCSAADLVQVLGWEVTEAASPQ